MLLILVNSGIKNFMSNPTLQEIYKLVKLNLSYHRYKILLNKNPMHSPRV